MMSNSLLSLSSSRRVPMTKALKQFQISLKLDPQIWQAREGLADANYMVWESRKDLSNRIRAAESYEELLSVKPREPASDIDGAKTRAKAKLALLDSPYGKWLTDYGVMRDWWDDDTLDDRNSPRRRGIACHTHTQTLLRSIEPCDSDSATSASRIFQRSQRLRASTNATRPGPC